ncbi:glycosyl hydrolase family 28-related protein [Chryseobacterium sp. NRRL B-14859]|uniref:glycosyl hydrolase family 28-related protein n=1 Tax=Chryseobacterium sp. NRRL B-14859 TaxID=1562763 RepID=UPI003392137B
MTKQDILNAIEDYVNSNGLQEISGSILNYILKAITNVIPEDTMLTSSFGGVVGPSSNIVVIPGHQQWFFANSGTYTNYGNLTFLPGKLNILSYDGSNWSQYVVETETDFSRVLKSFLQTTKIQWEEIAMPTAGEKDNAVIIIPGYIQHPETGWANGFIPISYLSGYEFIKVEGNLKAYGSSEIVWLGRGKDTAPTSYGTYLTGIPANNTFEMPVPTASNIEYIMYSRKKGDTKFYRGKTVTVPVEEDGVLNRILSEIAAVKSELSFKDFGAKCDGVTNDTNAFLAAMNALISQGGGKIRLSGIMLINQSAIPYVEKENFLTIEIVGDYTPTGVFGSVGEMPVNKKNSTILCNDVSYDDNKGVIYTTKGTSSQWAFNYITLVLRNIVIRTTDGAPIHGLNLHNFQQAIVENVNIDTGVYAGQASEPLIQSAGLIMPSRDNGALCIANNVYMSGYNIGMIPQEHTNADNLQINCCKIALQIQGAGHPIRINRVLVQKCPRIVYVKNQSNFEINQLVIEKASPGTITPGHGWQLPDTYDFYDENNNGRGYITWNTTTGGVSLDGTFNRTGGINVRTRKLGDINWI